MLNFSKLDSRNVSIQGVQNFVEQNSKTTAALIGFSVTTIIGVDIFRLVHRLLIDKRVNGLDIPVSSRGKDWTTFERGNGLYQIDKVCWAAQVYKWSWWNLSWVPDGQEQCNIKDK